MDLGSHRLREIRRQNGISQLDLAVKYQEITSEDMTQATVSRIERGDMILTFKHAVGFVKSLVALGAANDNGGELTVNDLIVKTLANPVMEPVV